MTKHTYHGSCRCKAITFEADIDLSAGTTKCNCTICWKLRHWGVQLKPDAFRLLTGADAAKEGARGGFCTRCGIRTFGVYNTDGWGWGDGGDLVSLSLSALDDLPIEDLLAAPVQYCDGLHDAWERAPEETRHL